MNFVPSHRVPTPGLATWATVDAAEPGEHRLGAGLQVQVLAVEGKRARIVCDNGWETWVSADELIALAAASAPAGPPAVTPPAPVPPPSVAREKRRRLAAIVAAAVVVCAGAGLALRLSGDDDGGGGSSSNPTTPYPTENLTAPASIGTYQKAPTGNTESSTAFLVGYTDVAAKAVLSLSAERVGEENVPVRLRSVADVLAKNRGPVSTLTVDGVTYTCATGGAPTRHTQCAWARGHTLFVILGPPVGDQAMVVLAAQAGAATRGT
jgi:hypothetical protein